jgi:hypothetical protein
MKELLVRGNSFYLTDCRVDGSARLFFASGAGRSWWELSLDAERKSCLLPFLFWHVNGGVAQLVRAAES